MGNENQWGSTLSFILAMIGSAVDLEIYGDIHMFFIQAEEEHFSFPILLQLS
jgi:SNF family Na+-dependent transporter